MKLAIIESDRRPSITDPDYVEYYSSPYKDTPYYKEATDILRARAIAYNPLNGDVNRDVKRRQADIAWKEFISKVRTSSSEPKVTVNRATSQHKVDDKEAEGLWRANNMVVRAGYMSGIRDYTKWVNKGWRELPVDIRMKIINSMNSRSPFAEM